jgi:hypothetical protein
MFRVKNSVFINTPGMQSLQFLYKCSLIMKNSAQMFETKNLENKCKIKTALHK